MLIFPFKLVYPRGKERNGWSEPFRPALIIFRVLQLVAGSRRSVPKFSDLLQI